jgi:hypothetical protein
MALFTRESRRPANPEGLRGMWSPGGGLLFGCLTGGFSSKPDTPAYSCLGKFTGMVAQKPEVRGLLRVCTMKGIQ